MTATVIAVATVDLRVGDRIRIPATLNSPEREETVATAPARWVLTAGPKAGQVARSGRSKSAPELWQFHTSDGVRTAPSLRSMSDDDVFLANQPTALRSATADAIWSVIR